MSWEVDNAWLWVLTMFLWVPFVVVAGFVDTWNTEGGRAWRAQMAHPFRAFRANHPRLALRLAPHRG